MKSPIHPCSNRFVILAAMIFVALACCTKAADEAPKLDAKRAYKYLSRICRIGPRISGSQGMRRQQQMIVKHFSKFECDVKFQPFDVRHPLTGTPVRMNNIIISWNPQAKQRVLLCCHYDTRPLPDRDRNPTARQRGTFIGANDGASGVALFMELAHHMAEIDPTYGVDFVIFDGEELIFGDQGEYFLGSKHFAEYYRDHPTDFSYVYGVLIDMIADRNLEIFMEKNSFRHAPELTKSIWQSAAQLQITEFVPKTKHEVLDDHLPLNEIAKIPTTDIIDFDYPYWHTTKDIPNACSGESMVKVGQVLLHWLQNVPAPQRKKSAEK